MVSKILGNVAKAGADLTKKPASERMADFKKRFGTQAMREESDQDKQKEPEFGGRSKTMGGPSVEEIQGFEYARQFKPEFQQMIAEMADLTGHRDYRITPSGFTPREKAITEKKAKGGSVSASKRADGCAQRGKTRGKMV